MKIFVIQMAEGLLVMSRRRLPSTDKQIPSGEWGRGRCVEEILMGKNHWSDFNSVMSQSQELTGGYIKTEIHQLES
jgi:hypothetical protein